MTHEPCLAPATAAELRSTRSGLRGPILRPRRRRSTNTGSSSTRLDPLPMARLVASIRVLLGCLASRYRVQQPEAGWRCTASCS